MKTKVEVQSTAGRLTIPFSDLHVGDWFEDASGFLYICVQCRNIDDSRVNAVSVKSCIGSVFDPTVPVVPVSTVKIVYAR